MRLGLPVAEDTPRVEKENECPGTDVFGELPYVLTEESRQVLLTY